MDHEFPRRRASDHISNKITVEVVADDLALLRQYTIAEFRKGDERMNDFHRDLQANTQVTMKVDSGLGTLTDANAEVLNILQSWKAANSFMVWLGKLAIFIVSVAGTISLTISAIKGKLF